MKRDDANSKNRPLESLLLHYIYMNRLIFMILFLWQRLKLSKT